MAHVRLTHGLERAARLNGAGLATVDGECSRTWSETLDRVARLASALRTHGLAEGGRVGVLSQNRVQYLEAFYAILWAGGVVVPFNTRLAEPELRFQMDDAGVGVLLFDADFATTARALTATVAVRPVCIAMEGSTEAGVLDYEELVARSEPVEDAGRSGDDLAGIFFTGGTTGLPKGVMLSHQGLHAMSVNFIMGFGIDDSCVNLHSAPMFHVSAVGIFFTTMVGGTHVFTPDLAPGTLLDLVDRHRVTHCFTVPAIIDRLVSHQSDREYDLSSLRIFGYGGSAIPVALIDAARARFPQVGLAHGYGMSEMPAMTLLGPSDHLPEAGRERLRSVGRAMIDYEIQIVDEGGAVVPPGVFGEIIGRGPNQMLGYWNRPEETASALRGGWMHSQDVGYLDDDGYLYVSDRLKDMIVTGAENVYSIEVEDVIYRHPDVAECTVIGVPDEVWGERVHAIIVPRAGAVVTGDDIVQFCRRVIARYKCPKTIEFWSDPLPRSAIGKVLKAELRARVGQANHIERINA